MATNQPESESRRWQGLRVLALAVVLSPSLLAGVVAAQAAADAADAMCATGLGPLLTLILGAITVVILLIAAFRGLTAWNNLGSAQKDKKKEGREQGKGALITLVGVFFPALFGVMLDTAGISTLSCIDWGNIIYLAPPLLPF